MYALNINQGSFVSLNEKKFRDNLAVRGNSAFVSLTTFLNAYINYELLSFPLDAGTHKFKVISEDDHGNLSAGVEDSVVIGAYVLPPYNLQITASGSDVVLTWEHSGDGAPTNYKIYSNSGSGYIDKVTPKDTIAGALLTKSYAALAAGTWLFVVEAETGAVESYNNYAVEQQLPTTAVIPPSITDEDYNFNMISARNVNAGKINFMFYWIYGSKASYFRLYHDSGTGTIDYSTYQRFARQDGELQENTTTQIYSGADPQAFLFAVRAESSDGVVETNTQEYEVELDGVAPDDIEDLTVV